MVRRTLNTAQRERTAAGSMVRGTANASLLDTWNDGALIETHGCNRHCPLHETSRTTDELSCYLTVLCDTVYAWPCALSGPDV